MLQYAITPGKVRSAQDFAALIKSVRALPDVDFILLRELNLAAGELLELAARVRDVLPKNARLLLHSRLDVAMAVGADGLHLSSAAGQLTPGQIRQILPDAIISRSCHTPEEVDAARQADVSIALFGPVFGKTVDGTAVSAAVGLASLSAACRVAGDMPVLALGGVTEENAETCVQAGARGVAGIRLYFR